MLNLSFKMLFPQNSEFNLKILTLLSVLSIKNDSDKKQVNVNSISLHKHFNNIFSLPKLSKYMDDRISQKKDEMVSIHIHIKVCYLHSAILNFYIQNFNYFYEDYDISKFSMNTLYSIYQNKYLNSDPDKLVQGMSNWMNDEKNYNDDVQRILELINWEFVSLECLLEFSIKFGEFIERCQIKDTFSKLIETKLCEALDYSRMV